MRSYQFRRLAFGLLGLVAACAPAASNSNGSADASVSPDGAAGGDGSLNYAPAPSVDGGSSSSSSSSSSESSSASTSSSALGEDAGAFDGGQSESGMSSGCSADIVIENVAFYGASGAADAASPLCPSVMPTGAAITSTTVQETAGAIVYGTQPYTWTTYTNESAGQAVPTLSLSPSNGALTLSATLTASAEGGLVFGLGGLYFASGATASTTCDNASAYSGITFAVTGNLGGCSLQFQVADSERTPPANSPRGTCAEGANCAAPSYALSQLGTVNIPFAEVSGGVPAGTVDPDDIISIQWVLEP